LVSGRYESWFLSARDTEPGRQPRALWIRHTAHRAAAAAETSGALWCTVFDPGAGAPSAVKQSLPAGPASNAGASGFHGEARARGRMAEWDLTVAGEATPLRHLRPRSLYRLPLPRTKLEAPVPDGTTSGRLVFDGAELDVVAWRATVGHNWGAEHAERWIWLHGSNFEGNDVDTWLDVAIGRIKVGPWTTPWVANGVLSLGGTRHALGGLGKRGTKIDEHPDHCAFTLPGSDLTISGEVHAPRERFVGWVYADPDGSEHNTVNCSIAQLTLNLGGRTLHTPYGAAYELGMREKDHGMEIQPFPDG
jgi:hypothetical protein